MRHRVALVFEDGVTRFISCEEDQTIADASYRARINIPLDCRGGACGTCKAFCESGEFDSDSYIEDALSADEEARGYVLPCSMKPRSDLVLQIATTSAAAKTGAATHNGTITRLDRLSSTTVALTMEIDDRDDLAFLPGQYVNIAVPGTEFSRSYSFSSAPHDKALTFLIKLTPGGVMSEYLGSRASVGDEISFTGPNGSFFLRESTSPLLLLAGGTGLAPILSIVRTLDAVGSHRPVHLLYGATTDDDVVELDTIEELASSIESLTWDYCVADKNTTAPHQGYLTSLIGPERLHDGNVAVYLCGPPSMVEAVRHHFREANFAPSGFYYEKFALAAAPPEYAGKAGEPEPAAEPVTATETEDGFGSTVVAVPSRSRAEAVLTLEGREGRSIAGQVMLPAVELEPLHGRRPPTAGPTIIGPSKGITELIGAENPSFHGADAIFDAWRAPEPGTRTTRPAMRNPAVANRPRFVTPRRFDGKVVLITGAAQGIGECTARRISAEGGTLVLADRAPLVEALATELNGNDTDAIGVVADLEGWERAEAVVAAALEQFGRIDIAIHTVGGTIWAKPFERYSPEQIQAEIDRSLWPTLWCCRAVAPHMIERREGTIVNVSSVATRGLNRVPYAAAKGGVNAITSALALELAAHGIRVVATAPGGTDGPPRRTPRGPVPTSEQEKKWYQTIVDQTTSSSLMKRYGTPDEQAAAITFLASDEASYITGTVLPVAGGDLG
jgi:benzoate/toluate 1,2-dioxygenase reductase subunit